MTVDTDLAGLLGSSCLQLQRTTRRVTQVYDRLLDPVGLTTNQFGLLANLAGMSASGLDAAGLVAVDTVPSDRRVRTVRITEAGRSRLSEALPVWRAAQAQLDQAIGMKARLALNALLELADDRLTSEKR